MGLLRRLHCEDDAQISILAVWSSVCFIALMAMVINTSDLVEDRTHMQDVADVTVLSTAAWSARGMNLISFINVLNTKLISTAVLVNALDDSIGPMIKLAQFELTAMVACSGLPYIGVACAIAADIIRGQISILQSTKSWLPTLANAMSRVPNGKLWTVMRGLSSLGAGIKAGFVKIGLAEAVAIARANGADVGVVVPGALINNPMQAYELPVTDGKFAAFCNHVKSGGSGYKLQGYECKQGPLKVGEKNIRDKLGIIFWNLRFEPIFSSMVRKNLTAIGCKADASKEKISFALQDLSQCRTSRATAQWVQVTSNTRPVTHGNWTYQNFLPWRPLNSAGSATSSTSSSEAYKALDPKTERTVSSAEVPCAGTANAYPYYRSGKISNTCSISGGGYLTWCTDPLINRVSDFHWIPNPSGEAVGGYFIRATVRPIRVEGESQQQYVYTVETVLLQSAGTVAMTPEQFIQEYGGGQAGAGSGSKLDSDMPQPWLLDRPKGQEDRFQDRLRFVGVVYKDTKNDRPFWSTFFDNPPPKMIAYAEAQVYNFLEEDTFTQDWRVRLEPAGLLQEAIAKMPGMGAIMPIKDRAAEGLSTVNNH